MNGKVGDKTHFGGLPLVLACSFVTSLPMFYFCEFQIYGCRKGVQLFSGVQTLTPQMRPPPLNGQLLQSRWLEGGTPKALPMTPDKGGGGTDLPSFSFTLSYATCVSADWINHRTPDAFNMLNAFRCGGQRQKKCEKMWTEITIFIWLNRTAQEH